MFLAYYFLAVNSLLFFCLLSLSNLSIRPTVLLLCILSLPMINIKSHQNLERNMFHVIWDFILKALNFQLGKNWWKKFIKYKTQISVSNYQSLLHLKGCIREIILRRDEEIRCYIVMKWINAIFSFTKTMLILNSIFEKYNWKFASGQENLINVILN